MKKLFVTIFLILSIFLVSCGENEEKTEKLQESSINMSTTETAVMGLLDDTILYSENSDNKLDRDYFEYYFGNGDLLNGITDYFFYTSATTSVSEAGAFKVKDSDTAKALLDTFDTRRDNLKAIYENYSPEDVGVAEKMIKGQNGDVVYFAMTKNEDNLKTIKDIFSGVLHLDVIDEK